MKCSSEVVSRLPWIGITLGLLALASQLVAADLSETRRTLLAGNYQAAIKQAESALKNRPDDERWNLLLSKALLATGRYPEANTAITNALAAEPRSIQLLWQAREVFRCNGQPDEAEAAVQDILRIVSRRPWDYRDATSLVIFGQAALLGGADPKRVLDQLFDTAKKADPELREVYLASGELALSKHDYALAAKRFEEGLKKLPDDADLQWGLARAYEPSHQSLMLTALDAALQDNTNHVGSLLLWAEHSIDAEDYEAAAKQLERIEAINPWEPDAWAFRAVIAHLQNRLEEEKTARDKALKFWPTNPRVDHLIGRKLSQKYRFAEGAVYQRRAILYDADYLPAKAQLAQDLLRLGDEAEGWELARAVQKEDAYDVAAFNLTALQETMSKFVTLTNEDFLVRMGSHEAVVYGPRVMALLERARSNLCVKYGMELKRPTIVEIFPAQKDFAVRTFGMPGNPGYLGVCFGSVITANSPASQAGNAVNWEAVLWHEFCHVVTLQMTRNKMPRWLSEGISVYEEAQANPAWGQHMNPQYREMIMEGELTPLSQLSSAFMAPPSEMHLQFAYFESAMVVEFLRSKYSLDQMKALLRDLADGTEINAALEKHFAPMETLEPEFETFARTQAEQLGPELGWEKPAFSGKAARERRGKRPSRVVLTPPVRQVETNQPPAQGETNQFEGHPTGPPAGEQTWAEWAAARPTNFWVMTRKAEQLVAEKKWDEAGELLEKLIALYPDFIGPDGGYAMLAIVHRSTGDAKAEREVLAKLAARDDEAIDAYLRLMELGKAAEDWADVALNADRYLAVNPLVSKPYRFLAQASEKTDATASAIMAYQALANLDPPDPAYVHFRLAQLMHKVGDAKAKRHVLQALEEAPNYLDALRLLLELNKSASNKVSSATVEEGLR